MFPTPPPSRRKRLPAAEYKEHKQRKAQRKQQSRSVLPTHREDDPYPAGSESPSSPISYRDGAAAAGQTVQPGSEGLHVESSSALASIGGNGSYISAQQQGGMQQHSAGHVQHPSTSGDVPSGRTVNSSSQMHAAYSAALTNAASTASSLPLAVDESPGWGADQGRGRPSLDLDQQNPHVSTGSSVNLRQGGSKSTSGRHRIGAASRALGQSWFALPNHRQQAGPTAAGGAGPVAEGVRFVGEGQYAVDLAPGSPSSILHSHSPRERVFVTVDL